MIPRGSGQPALVALLKRFAVTLLGGGLVLLGLALMVLPGPGFLVVVVGLTVLATEYAWARRLLKRARSKAEEAQRAAVASRPRLVFTVLFALGMVAVGVGAFLFPDLPFASPVTGTCVLLGGVILLTTTIITARVSAGRPTTYDEAPARTGGAHRLDPEVTA